VKIDITDKKALVWPLKVSRSTKFENMFLLNPAFKNHTTTTQKKTFSEFICSRWYSSTGDDLKTHFLYQSPFLWLKVTNNGLINWIFFCFVDYRKNWCLISSLVDNWDLDEFLERFIRGRWYFHLQQTIYHLCQPIIIPSGWLSPTVVEYHLQWLIVISRINHHRWYSSFLNEYRFHRMKIVCSRWISSPSDEYHLL
jgi:hypothetical protein